MSNNTIARVHYFERQFLRTQDFTDEQAYHLAMQRRHNIAHHTWGIVRGLELYKDKDGNLWVLPGVAVDGYGRYLILADQQSLPPQSFDEKRQDVLDVWLVYALQSSDDVPKGYGNCGDGQADTFYRWLELPIIRLEAPDLAYPDRRQPKSVPAGDLSFDPTRTPPDDPQAGWPVFLGQVTRTPPKPNQPFTYSVNLADRPYVGLVGTSIVTPSGQARVQLEAETAEDRAGFVIFLSDPLTKTAQPRLQIDPQGPATVFGNITLYGNLTVDGGTIEVGTGGVVETPRPWQIYHTKDAQGAPNDPNLREDLRIELPEGNGSNQVAIGTWSANEKTFKPCLTVADDCTVTVHGNLIVEGFIARTQADTLGPTLSDAATGFLTASYSAAAGSVTPRLEQLYTGPSGIDLAALGKLLDTEAGRQQVVVVIAAQPERLRAFIDALLANTAALQDAIASLVANHARAVADALAAVNAQAIIEALLANQSALQAVLNGLLASPAGRQAAAESLLANDAGQQAVVNALLGHPDQLRALLTRLLENEGGRQAVAESLLASDAGQQAVADELLGDPEQLRAFLTKLLQTDAGRQAVAENLLATDEGRRAAADGLLGSDEGRQAVLNTLLAHQDWATAFFGLALGSGDAQRLLARSLQAHLDQVRDFAQLIRDDPEFQGLEDRLREILCPPPPG